MQLSIIIPNYNFDCSILIEQLQEQCKRCNLLTDYEIIISDDGSNITQCLAFYEKLISNKQIRVVGDGTNHGLSHARNFGIKESKYPYILLMDNDALIDNEKFIDSYIKNINKAEVLCGGIITSEKYKTSNNSLRLKYEKKAYNIRTIKHRNQHPYNNFSAFNIFFKKSIFEKICFNEDISTYGYEDALFGLDLLENNIEVFHIDNPLIHTGIDSNKSFLTKTEKALINLYKYQDKFNKSSKLLQTYKKIESYKLDKILQFLFKNFKKHFLKNLIGENPSLFIFNIYKLGLYNEIVVQNKKMTNF